MAIELRIVDGRGVEKPQNGVYSDFGEAMRSGIRLADALGRVADYETAKTRAVRLYAGNRRVLSIVILKGGLPDR